MNNSLGPRFESLMNTSNPIPLFYQQILQNLGLIQKVLNSFLDSLSLSPLVLNTPMISPHVDLNFNQNQEIKDQNLQVNQNVITISSEIITLSSLVIQSMESNCPTALSAFKKSKFRPGFWTRNWIPALVSVSCSVYVIKNASLHWKTVTSLSREIYKTCTSFIQSYLMDPLFQIYETIRYKESRLKLMGADSLNSDLESLERMYT